MLAFARSCVGKPFSGTAMARSVFWPRKTDHKTFFCAELVASVLKSGGLLDPVSNPGAATPESLHELYKSRATTTANPYVLRQANCQRQLTTNSVVQQRFYTPPSLQYDSRTTTFTRQQPQQPQQPQRDTRDAYRSIAAATTPMPTAIELAYTGKPRSALRVLNAGTTRHSDAPRQLGITLNSLDFRR